MPVRCKSFGICVFPEPCKFGYFILPGIIHPQVNTGIGGEISSEGESDRDWQLIPTKSCKRQPYNCKQFVVSLSVPLETLQQYNLKTEILPHLPDPLTIPQVPLPFFAMCPSPSVADPPYTSPSDGYYFPFEEEVVVDKPVPESQSPTSVLHNVDPDPDPDQESEVDDDPIHLPS